MKLKHLEPVAKEAIDTAKRDKTFIMMTIDGFRIDEEALILLDMLRYANQKKVEIRIIPNGED